MLNIFYQCYFGYFLVVGDVDVGGNFFQFGELGGVLVVFFGDDLVFVVVEVVYGDGLNEFVGFQGIGQFLQGFWFEFFMWLVWVGGDLYYGDYCYGVGEFFVDVCWVILDIFFGDVEV